MKDIGKANYILGIQILRDRKNRNITLAQASYIDKILVHFAMQNSKKGCTLFRKGVTLSKDQCPKTPDKEAHMRRVCISGGKTDVCYAILYTGPDICYVVGIISHYQSNPGLELECHQAYT